MKFDAYENLLRSRKPEAPRRDDVAQLLRDWVAYCETEGGTCDRCLSDSLQSGLSYTIILAPSLAIRSGI